MLTCQEDEASWLLNQTRSLINQLKIAILTEAFETCMHTVNQTYATKIFCPNKQNNNLPSFLDHAVVKINMTDSLLPHVMRQRWDEIEKIFYESLHSYEKYKTRPVQLEETNDEDTVDTDASTFQDSNST
jgi:hypothetical protein